MTREKYPIPNRWMCGLYEFRRLPVGSKVWFAGEVQGYTVRASNVAFCVLTKPFNARKTTLYCIIDWESGVRGPENLIFGMGAETDQECEEMLDRITSGESEVSGRHYTDLYIVKYWNPSTKKYYTEQSVGGTKV